LAATGPDDVGVTRQPHPEDPRLTRWKQRTFKPLNILAVVWVVAWVLPWFWTDPPAQLVQLSNTVNFVVWVFFVVDYVVRLSLSHPRWRFVVTHPVDLVVILVPPLRVLRGLALLRNAMKHSNGQLVQSILIIVGVVVFFGAALVWQLESRNPTANIQTFPESLWWAAVTTTTVGYGDFFPVTLGGRITASGLMLVGIGLVGTVSATLASWFVKRRQPAADGETSGPGSATDAAAGAATPDSPGSADGSQTSTTTSGPVATSPAEASRDLFGRIDALQARMQEIDAQQRAVRHELWDLLGQLRTDEETAAG
jgi:voltage-gated potassium channel